MSRTIALVFLAACALARPVAFAITIPTVPVGNAGNAPDRVYSNSTLNPFNLPFGAVAYNYRIGTYEVTVGQYTAFLNAVAATDTYNLYNPSMATNLNIAGISRGGTSGSYTYSVIGSPNKPVTYVNWGDAARFANWLHNGQPTGPQNASTTEDGAYTLEGGGAVTRNTAAHWFLPSENEWYKAAYYQPAAQGGDSDSYWEYPMRTNSVPYSAPPPGSAAPDITRVANFFETDSLPNGYNDGLAVTGALTLNSSQNYLTDVGAYSSSSSFYGTFDQGGNVWEWNEGSIDGLLAVRGGSWTQDGGHASGRIPVDFFSENFEVGFRVATLVVPEPSSIALAAVALVGLVALCRRRMTKRC